jgi:hypothetical protein
MAARFLLHSPVLARLAAEPGIQAVFLSDQPEHADTVAASGADHLGWRRLASPVEPAPGLTAGPWPRAGRRLAHRLWQRATGRWAGFGNLVFRFNEIQGFAGHRRKKLLPPDKLEREALAGNHPDPRLGRPFPRSRLLLRLLYASYYSTWYSEPGVEAFCDQYRPHLLVLYHLQHPGLRPWLSAARRRRLPVLGIVGSWDQPTTKGPLCPGVESYAVQSRRMASELVRLHGVDPSRVAVTGWPQMDPYRDPALVWERERLCAEIGAEPERALITLGANSARLGAHEPSIAGRLAEWVASGGPGRPATLVIRPHPKDGAWRERFGGLHRPPHCLVLPREVGRLELLANLLRHSAALLASSGSVLLDAVALDTCAIGIAYDGDLEPPRHQSIARAYEQDHYRPVVTSGGVRLARDHQSLLEAVAEALADPGRDAAGRAALRAEHLEPLDGRASERLVWLILARAFRAAAEAR